MECGYGLSLAVTTVAVYLLGLDGFVPGKAIAGMPVRGDELGYRMTGATKQECVDVQAFPFPRAGVGI